MLILLIIILVIAAALPLLFRKVEENIELFILAIGVCAAALTGTLTGGELSGIFSDVYLYLITAAVLAFSTAFMLLDTKIAKYGGRALGRLPVGLGVFVLITTIGLLSCVITSVIAALLLAELVALLPLERHKAVWVNILACFSIGLGSILTPMGGPLSAIVASGLHAGFWSLFTSLWLYIMPLMLLLGAVGALLTRGHDPAIPEHTRLVLEKHRLTTILSRTGRIFAFIIGLELLGAAFRPVVEQYVLHWNNSALYAVNVLSAVLDNAMLAAAEISTKLHPDQVKTILMSLLISGGMLITGNIPNIITAGRLKIKSRDWAKFALPVGAAMMVVYYVVGFVLKV